MWEYVQQRHGRNQSRKYHGFAWATRGSEVQTLVKQKQPTKNGCQRSEEATKTESYIQLSESMRLYGNHKTPK